jgi:hypothetical protein
MKNEPLNWSRIFAGWAALFFLVTALAPTLLIAYVWAYGQRIEVSASAYPYTYAWLGFKPYWRAEIEYQYTFNRRIYTSKIDIRPDKYCTDFPPGTWLYNPFPETYCRFDIMVWDQLPQFSIPNLPEYQPLAMSVPLWIMAVAALLIYVWMRRSTHRELPLHPSPRTNSATISQLSAPEPSFKS